MMILFEEEEERGDDACECNATISRQQRKRRSIREHDNLFQITNIWFEFRFVFLLLAKHCAQCKWNERKGEWEGERLNEWMTDRRDTLSINFLYHRVTVRPSMLMTIGGSSLCNWFATHTESYIIKTSACMHDQLTGSIYTSSEGYNHIRID